MNRHLAVQSTEKHKNKKRRNYRQGNKIEVSTEMTNEN